MVELTSAEFSKSGSLDHLESSGSVQTCTGISLRISTQFITSKSVLTFIGHMTKMS